MSPEEKKVESERRQYIRVKKNFILSYHEKDNPLAKNDISQLKNISLGGMCFVTAEPFSQSTKLAIELKTPFLAGMTRLDATVLESHERAKDILYETRVSFDGLSAQSRMVLEKVVEYFKGQQ